MITFAGQSMRDSSSPGSQTSRLINLYREPVGDGGKTQFLLRAAMGMEILAELDGVFTRDLFAYDDAVIAMVSGQLYKISGDGVLPIGAVTAGDIGQISRNGKYVTAVSGGKYYVWNPDTLSLTEPAAGPIESLASVDFLAGRTVLGELGGSRFCWSDIGDPSTLNGLNFATAEQRDDRLVRLMVVNGVIMLLGERSTEMWAPTGQGGAAVFALLGGSVVDRGLKSFNLACKAEGGLFVVGNDGIAYIIAGNQWAAVSTPAVNTAIKDGDPTTCIYWEDRGHKFAAITFDDRPAWVYDFATTEWWERAEGNGDPWRATAAARMGGGFVVGLDNGNIFRLTNTPQDNGGPLWRRATSYTVYQGGNWFTLAAVEFLFGQGFQGGPFNIMLEIGKGETFSPPRHLALGSTGDFGNRAKFSALGRHQVAVARLTITDPFDVPIYSDAEVRFA